MKVQLKKNVCIVTKEKVDPYFPNNFGSWGKGESRLLYHIKNILNSRGFDFIKKRMGKDGHLVDDRQQYLRSRRAKNGKMTAIYNGFYAIEGINEAFNKDGQVSLIVEHI